MLTEVVLAFGKQCHPCANKDIHWACIISDLHVKLLAHSTQFYLGLWQAKDASRDELQRVSRAIDEGHPISAELPLSTKLGGRIWSQMSMTPVMSESDPSIVENHVRPSTHVHACVPNLAQDP